MCFLSVFICVSLLTIPAKSSDKCKVVLLQFENSSSYKGKWDIEEGFTATLLTKLTKLDKYEVIVPERKLIGKIYEEIRKVNKTRESMTSSTEHISYLAKFFDAEMVITGNIEKFAIKRFAFINPKLGGVILLIQ